MNKQNAITSTVKPFQLMGVVNITPDSFYDGGRHTSVQASVDYALRLCDEGADIIDIGGASSRPGALIVTPEEELNRIRPIVELVAKKFSGPISIDTTWSSVARAALDGGATWINDISAGRFDSQMRTLIAEKNCTVVLMHSRGTPQTMQNETHYNDLVTDVRNELLKAVSDFISAGVSRERIILDPGIGFAKTVEQNIELMQNLEAFTVLGYPLLVGTSRKSFIGQITGRNPDERLFGTLGSVASAYLRGARIFRVHDVLETADFLKVFSVIEKKSAH
jgi:dihydropteroate synthase